MFSSGAFQGSKQRSLQSFITTEKKLVAEFNAILRPMENSFCWTLSRVMSEISQLKTVQLQFKVIAFLLSLHFCSASSPEWSLPVTPYANIQLTQQEVSVVCFEALGVARLPCWRLVCPQCTHDCQLKRPTTPNCSAFYRYFPSSVTI